MPESRRLFLSMVSDEFRGHRALLAKDIKRSGVEVCTQEDFANLGETTLQKLDTYLAQCHAIIHVVGDGVGHIPPAAAVDALLQRHPDFLAALAQYTGITRAQLALCSYTQWEAYLAVFHKVRLHIYRPAPGAPREPGFVTSAAEQDLQDAHFERIRKLGRDRDVFLTDERLSSFVLADLGDILPHLESRLDIPPTRLTHSADVLIGRELELSLLDSAWNDPHSNVVVIRGKGGEGKTSLVASWMAELAFKDWRGAERVLDWSFYSQGTRDQTAATAEFFFNRLLTDLSDPDPNAGSPEDRAARLAVLLNQQRTLLVLDGLEPLQYPPGPMHGALKDGGMAALLRALVAKNAGLVVVTTRERVDEIQQHYGRSAIDHDLQFLSPLAGAALLHHAGARRAGHQAIAPDDAELQQTSIEVKGHALTLFLIGNYLNLTRAPGVEGGDIRQRGSMKLAEADHEYQTDRTRPYGHAFKAIEAYERWFAAGDESAHLQLSVLRLLGLFDRPASAASLTALRQPPIPGLTDLWAGQTERQWRITLNRLQEIKLLEAAPDGSIDAHPLIREYFSEQLRSRHLPVFQSAHSRLFDYLRESTEHQPDTLDGLQPLYQAVIHGCLAGRQQEACVKVYIDRILRGTGSGGFYSTRNLGAIGADLGAVAAFFELPWTRLSPNLSEAAQAWLLNEAARRLSGLGRLTEALEPMRVALEINTSNESWENAAVVAGNLSELEVTLGHLGSATADARRAINFADRSGDVFQRIARTTDLAAALNQSGQSGEAAEAHTLFAAAEALQREHQPQFPLLYSVQGFRYCDLILAPAERAARQLQKSQSPTSAPDIESALTEAARRATQTLEWGNRFGSLLSIALDHLTLARVALYRAALATQPPAANANPHLAPALNGLRKAGDVTYLAIILLTAAHWHALIGDPTTTRRHLDEAQQIAERGPMPLHLADVHLHRARLVGMLPPDQRAQHWPGIDPKAELASARALIEKHGYGRRREELADAEQAAEDW
jgi:hypothetical protein